MKLSIIIVNYNTSELLRKCLESVISDWLLVVRNQSPVTNHQPPTTNHQPLITEIIVVDNGSTDKSVEMVKSLPTTNHQPPTTNHQSPVTLRLITNEENLGFAKAVNQGLRQSQGEIVLLLNSDTIVKDGVLEKLIEFEKKVRPAIIGARLLNPDNTVQSSVFHLPTIKRAIMEYWFRKKGAFSKYAPEEGELVEVEAVSGGAMLISKEIIDKIGMLDERYFMYFEDLDYCRRARKSGFKIFYLPGTEIIHEHGASGQSLSLPENQWRRLIPSSKIYYGWIKHYLISFILWSGQKWSKTKKH